ncbi:MAG: 1-phosphofructokinase family hexose kinase [Aestuariivirga sp.]
MHPILTITLNPAIDMTGVAEVVRPTRKTRMTTTKYEPGGGGINVARVIAVLGGDAEAVYLAGGELGSFLDRLLQECNIRCRSIPISGQTRISFMVREKTTGFEYRFIPAGSPVQREDMEPCFDAILSQTSGYVVASGSLPLGAPADTYARMARSSAGKRLKFVLDTSGAGLKVALETARLFLVKPSRGEFEQLAGQKLDEEGIRNVAAGLVARGAAEFVAVTMGADGALLASASGILRLPAIPVSVRSAVGAGDSFVGAMVWAMSQGRSPEEAFKLGIAAGAAAVMTPGTELCRREDILQLYHSSRG